mmetsp:Transcript_55549/g.140790  ORF Transcript_55549/g.140790 Transcript_55549/m.140790 type:complete len:129 (-) Transcript_55549:75-461(-)
MLGEEPKATLVDKVTNFFVDNLWQYAHIAGAAFLFYEDRLLCSCSIAGFVGLIAACMLLEATRVSPTHGDRLWRTVVPVCGALAVVFSIGARLMGWTSHMKICGALLAVCFGITMVTVKGDKDARLRL